MTRPPEQVPEASGLAFGLDTPPAAPTADLARFVAHAFGPSALAIVHYGSHAQRSGARSESAYDFFVIVDHYGPAYRALAASGAAAFRTRVAILLSAVLPPNVIAVRQPGDDTTPAREAKCAVFSRADFLRACSRRTPDHFAQGRLMQHAQLVWARDAAGRKVVREAIVEARRRTIVWGRSFLPERFDAEAYSRALLETSFAAEIRPEASDRIDALLTAQRHTMIRGYDAFLRRLAAESIVAFDGKVYTDRHPAGPLERWRWRWYFRRSKLRATLRWLKYVALYEDWLDYIVRKIERRSGVVIALTERQRRWPFIFLWPTVIGFIRSRPQRRR